MNFPSSSHSRLLKSLGGALLLSAFSTAAQAVVLVDNFANEGTDAAAELTNLSQYFATQFTTGPSAAVISTATVKFYNDDNQSHTLVAYLYSNSTDGLPDTRLVTSATASVPNGAPSEPVFDFGAYAMSANTSYWLVYSLLEPSNVEPVYGWFTSDNAETSDYGWTIGWDSARSADGGSTWVLDENDLSFIRLESGVIPEPSTYASVAGLAVGALALGLRRRRKTVGAV